MHRSPRRGARKRRGTPSLRRLAARQSDEVGLLFAIDLLRLPVLLFFALEDCFQAFFYEPNESSEPAVVCRPREIDPLRLWRFQERGDQQRGR